MNDGDPPRLSLDADDAFLRDAIEDSKRDLPDETRLAAIALKLGPVLGAGAVGGGGAAAASGAGAAKASVAPAAAKIGAMTAGSKIAIAIGMTMAIGTSTVVATRMVLHPSPVRVAPTTTTISTTPTRANSAATTLALTPASASAAPTPTAPPTATMIAAPNPNDETRNLSRARAVLANDPKTALSICNDDLVTFPHGQLAQDCEVTAIDALTRLGRMPEARARAKKFERDYPGSADIQRVHHLIGQD